MTHWWDHAACSGKPTEWWFTERTYRKARQICQICPVRQACLDDAMTIEAHTEHSGRWGLWGGLTPTERWELTDHR